MKASEHIFEDAKKNIKQQLDELQSLIAAKREIAAQKLSHLLQLALDLGEDELATRAYCMLSLHQSYYLRDHIKALDFARLALQQSEALQKPYWRVSALNRAATCYHMLRDYPAELNNLQEALEILEAPECASEEYYTLHQETHYGLSVIYSQMGLHAISLPYTQKALEFSEKMNDRGAIFRSKLTVANLTMYSKKFDEALKLYLELMDAYPDMKDTDSWSILNNYIGIVYRFQEKYDEAEKYVREAVRIRQALGDDLRLNYSYFTLAKLLYLRGATEEADQLLEVILRVMDKYPHSYDKQMRNDILYELYGAKGDYKKSYEHFKELDIGFVDNDLLERTIGSIFDAERNKQLRIQEDKEYFKKLNEEIRQQANELQTLNKDLHNYARTASHDLREPLRMVYTYMQILESKIKEKLSPEERQFLQFAVDGSKRMDEMITRILNSAKGAKISYKPVRLQNILEQVKSNLNKLISEKNAVLNFGDLPIVMADDVQMMQVFQNLITNAIKYNVSEKPTVDIIAENHTDSIFIAVTDNGVGIPEAMRSKVFEMFSRVGNASGADGTGIGLSTVKGIIEKMEGKISIADNPTGGTKFIIELPVNMKHG